MEYLVTMTTHVPQGTADREVDDVRAREAARSRELAAQGNLRRLWRPPLQSGEWRTLGLFAAEDVDDLAGVLASMPLHVWRTDEVTPLSRHPGDPDAEAGNGWPEFLTTFTTVVPAGPPSQAVEEAEAREAIRTRELARQGHLARLWTLPGQDRTLGLWRASDAADLQKVLASLPLYGWLTIDVTPLTEHPSDPAIGG